MSTYTKKRSSNFTLKETKTLLALIRKYRIYVECRKTDNKSNELKNAAWDKITREFNSLLSDGAYRSVQTLRLRFENVKRQSRKKFKLSSQISKNGFDRWSSVTLNIIDIDKNITKTPLSAVKIEISDYSDEIEEEEDSSKVTATLDNPIAENTDIIDFSEDHKFILVNDVEDSTVVSGTEMSVSALVNGCHSSADETLDVGRSAIIENEPPRTTLENLDTVVLTTEDLREVKTKCFLEEHNLKLKHMEEVHKVMIQHQQFQNKLIIRQLEEIHKEKLRLLKEEHTMKMKILDFQRIASL